MTEESKNVILKNNSEDEIFTPIGEGINLVTDKNGFVWNKIDNCDGYKRINISD